MSGMDPKKNGKVGIASILFIFGFDILSGAVGVIMAIVMQPGKLRITFICIIYFSITIFVLNHVLRPFNESLNSISMFFNPVDQ